MRPWSITARLTLFFSAASAVVFRQRTRAERVLS